MMYGTNETCASCARFPINALMTDGEAICTDGLEELRRYDWPACVLHKGGSREDRQARRIMAGKLKEGA